MFSLCAVVITVVILFSTPVLIDVKMLIGVNGC